MGGRPGRLCGRNSGHLVPQTTPAAPSSVAAASPLVGDPVIVPAAEAFAPTGRRHQSSGEGLTCPDAARPPWRRLGRRTAGAHGGWVVPQLFVGLPAVLNWLGPPVGYSRAYVERLLCATTFRTCCRFLMSHRALVGCDVPLAYEAGRYGGLRLLPRRHQLRRHHPVGGCGVRWDTSPPPSGQSSSPTMTGTVRRSISARHREDDHGAPFVARTVGVVIHGPNARLLELVPVVGLEPQPRPGSPWPPWCWKR